MLVRVGSGVPTNRLPWRLSRSFKAGSHERWGLLCETEDPGSRQTTARVPVAVKPTDDSRCEGTRGGDRPASPAGMFSA